MLTKEQASAKELIDSGWIVSTIKAQIASQLEERPHKRSFMISINDVEKIPTKEKILGTRKFIEKWLSEYGWELVDYACIKYGVLSVEIE